MQIKAEEMYVSCEGAACLKVLVSELMVSADMRKHVQLCEDLPVLNNHLGRDYPKSSLPVKMVLNYVTYIWMCLY